MDNALNFTIISKKYEIVNFTMFARSNQIN